VCLPGEGFGSIDSLAASKPNDTLKFGQRFRLFHQFVILKSCHVVYKGIIVKILLKNRPKIGHCDDEVGPLHDIYQLRDKVAAVDCLKEFAHGLASNK
jgi:hypothetical protein